MGFFTHELNRFWEPQFEWVEKGDPRFRKELRKVLDNINSLLYVAPPKKFSRVFYPWYQKHHNSWWMRRIGLGNASHKYFFVGDSDSGYLPFVEDLIAHYTSRGIKIKFVCMERSSDLVFTSWKRRLGENIQQFLETISPARKGIYWLGDRWTGHYPNMVGPSQDDSIVQYIDHYRKQSTRLAEMYPETFCIFKTKDLKDAKKLRVLLDFLGYIGLFPNVPHKNKTLDLESIGVWLYAKVYRPPMRWIHKRILHPQKIG